MKKIIFSIVFGIFLLHEPPAVGAANQDWKTIMYEMVTEIRADVKELLALTPRMERAEKDIQDLWEVGDALREEVIRVEEEVAIIEHEKKKMAGDLWNHITNDKQRVADRKALVGSALSVILAMMSLCVAWFKKN